MKCDVELLLPRKKEIIIYAIMTDHQKIFQDHLVNRTLEAHLGENAIPGTCFYALQFASSALLCSSLILSGQGWKGKLNNLVIQLRKNCNHPDLLVGQLDGSCMCQCAFPQMCSKFYMVPFCLIVPFLNRSLPTFGRYCGTVR